MVAGGEIWWHEDPEEGRRPYLILTRSETVPVLSRLLAVPATKTIRGIPTEVSLDERDGMPRPCVLSLDNVSVIRKALCTRRVTTLGHDKMLAVCEALRTATAC